MAGWFLRVAQRQAVEPGLCAGFNVCCLSLRVWLGGMCGLLVLCLVYAMHVEHSRCFPSCHPLTLTSSLPGSPPHHKHPQTLQARDWYREDLIMKGVTAAEKMRENLFLVSKIHPRDLGQNASRAAFERILRDLQTDYLDLLLMHYPRCFPGIGCDDKAKVSFVQLHQPLSTNCNHPSCVSIFPVDRHT